jgi:hypothetical protein
VSADKLFNPEELKVRVAFDLVFFFFGKSNLCYVLGLACSGARGADLPKEQATS